MRPLNVASTSRRHKNLTPIRRGKIVPKDIEAVNDDILETCDGYRFIDGVHGVYEVGFNFLDDGDYEVVHFLDIDGIQVWPDIFECDYVERKLNRILLDEAVYEAEME